ncbi:MAG: putative DNA binding domain-containing protein [Bacteroidales bacterium]|nr:putative DNA binding domain-containing protein [Bacteroidales bacterium]
MDNTLDIVMRENDFVLYENGKPLLSNGQNMVAHTNARLLRMAVSYVMFNPDERFSPLTLLKTISDTNVGAALLTEDAVKLLLANDPYLSGQQTKHHGLNEIIENSPALLDFIFLNASSISSALGNFLAGAEDGQSKEAYIITTTDQLSIEQKASLNALISEYEQGIVVHLLFISGYLSVGEYANSLIASQIKENHPGISLAMKESRGLTTYQKKITEKAQLVSDFLTLCKSSNKVSVIEEIIARGEDGRTEFKSTLRWDLYQSKKSPAIEHASLKSICAFLNSEGGDLLIGVRDDGSIEGIETDQFPNEDKFLLHLWMLIKTCMGQEVVEWVKTSLQKIGGRTVCRVHCQKAKKPVFLNQKGFDEAFYVRVGPSSGSLDISAALKYIKEHF